MNGVSKDGRGSCVALEVEGVSPGPKHFQRMRDEEVMCVGWKERNKRREGGKGRKGKWRGKKRKRDK